MNLWVSAVCFTLIVTTSASDVDLGSNPDVHRSMEQLITSKGFPVERHWVTTEDGYILGCFRIPHGNKNDEHSGARPPFLLWHGLLDSSTTWVNNPEDVSLAFVMANAGFDVWMGNSRGNLYSTNHTKLKTNSREFWETTFDEQAKYDLPNTVDYILSVTKFKTLGYAGHSQGTIQAFAGFSISKDLSSKVNFFGALAPVAHVEHITGGLRLLVDFDVDKLVQLVGFKDFLPSSKLLRELFPDFCKISEFLCANILFFLCGFDSTHLNEDRLPVYVAHAPSGTPVRNMVHWAQMVRQKRFQMYDFGCHFWHCANKDHYGQKTPPEYKLDAVTVPTVLYWGKRDFLADPTDVKRMMEELPAATMVDNIYDEEYEHLDYVWAQDANSRVYSDLVERARHFADTNPSVEAPIE